MRPELLNQLVQQPATDVRVGHFPAPEQHGQLHLVASVQKLGRLSTLRFEIVVVDLGPDSDLFEFDDVLVLPGVAFFAALLILEFPVVHQATDGRHRVRRNLNQIQPTLASHL